MSKITGFDFLILLALLVILSSFGIRSVITWNQDWQSIFMNMTVMNWIKVAVINNGIDRDDSKEAQISDPSSPIH